MLLQLSLTCLYLPLTPPPSCLRGKGRRWLCTLCVPASSFIPHPKKVICWKRTHFLQISNYVSIGDVHRTLTRNGLSFCGDAQSLFLYPKLVQIK